MLLIAIVKTVILQAGTDDTTRSRAAYRITPLGQGCQSAVANAVA